MKEDTKLQVCRLCLSLVEDETFCMIEDVKKEMLVILLPQLNLDISNNPLICRACTESLQKSYDFKMEYLNYSHNLGTDMKCEDYHLRCTVCYLSKKKMCSVEENILLKEMLEKCLPEVNFVEQASICEVCLESLQNQFNFTTACLEVEEKLATYNTKSGNDKDIKINLFDILQSNGYKKDDNIRDSYSGLQLVTIKKENEGFYCHSAESDKIYGGIPQSGNNKQSDTITCSYDGFEFVPIKKENAEFCEINSVEDSKLFGIRNIKSESFIQQEDVEIKSDQDEDFREKKIYKCNLCDYQTFRKTDLTLRHMLKHKKPGEVPMFKCTECSYQSKRRGDLNSHLATHNDSVAVYRCVLCHYKSIHKDRFEEHILRHNLPEKYQCEHCSYKASYKKSLVKHLRTHKRIAMKKVYKCHLCPYETKRRTDLADKHMLIHRTPDEVTMYKCPHCDFQAKHKSSVNRHTLKHKNPDEITMYKCPQCEFHTKQKRYLTIHGLIHKNSEEVMTFKCDQCPYEAKHKAYLRKHKAVHRMTNELDFRCNLCSYKTNAKCNLQRHLKRHVAKLMAHYQ